MEDLLMLLEKSECTRYFTIVPVLAHILAQVLSTQGIADELLGAI